MPPELERALRERIVEPTHLEQAHDVDELFDLIVPAFLYGQARARSAESFGRFVSHVRSAELVSLDVERWQPTLEYALVRYVVRYNGSFEPATFRTFWCLHRGQ